MDFGGTVVVFLWLHVVVTLIGAPGLMEREVDMVSPETIDLVEEDDQLVEVVSLP